MSISIVSVCGGLFCMTPAHIDEETNRIYPERALPKASVHDYIIRNGDTQTVYAENGEFYVR